MTAKIVTPIELKKGAVYWLEQKDEGIAKVVKVTLNSIDRNARTYTCKFAYDFLAEPFRDNMAPAYYRYECNFNQTWRCWSHKPTDEQREEAEWDE